MYTYEGFEYTDEEVQEAANKANLSIKDYTDKNNITLKDKDPEPKKATGAAQGVVAGPQMPQEITPGFMPQPAETPKSTELVSEDISSDSWMMIFLMNIQLLIIVFFSILALILKEIALEK
jgi:hypothetical protein